MTSTSAQASYLVEAASVVVQGAQTQLWVESKICIADSAYEAAEEVHRSYCDLNVLEVDLPSEFGGSLLQRYIGVYHVASARRLPGCVWYPLGRVSTPTAVTDNTLLHDLGEEVERVLVVRVATNSWPSDCSAPASEVTHPPLFEAVVIPTDCRPGEIERTISGVVDAISGEWHQPVSLVGIRYLGPLEEGFEDYSEILWTKRNIKATETLEWNRVPLSSICGEEWCRPIVLLEGLERPLLVGC